MPISIYIHIYIHVCTNTCIYIYTHAYTYIYIYKYNEAASFRVRLAQQTLVSSKRIFIASVFFYVR